LAAQGAADRHFIGENMIDRTWELMQSHLDADSFYMVASHDSAPDESALRSVADSLGCALPDEFIAHATNRYGGLYVEVREELWPRPKEFDVGPFWSFLYGLYTLNISEGIPDFMNLESNAREFQSDTQLTAIPFLKIVSDANAYCFTSDGKIAQWDHELNELEEQEHSFFELLDFELGELVERKNRKVAGEGA
jgi:hypothetical protein